MEKNLAAFLREDTKTVGVRFIKDSFDRTNNYQENLTLLGEQENTLPYDLSTKEYTYITDLPLSVGDRVVVFAQSTPKVVVVTRVDEIVNILPKDQVEYKWVVSQVDFTAYNENMKKNSTITDFVRSAYRKNVKEQFKDIVLAGLDAKNRKALTNLLKGS